MKRLRVVLGIMMDSPDYFTRPLDVRLNHAREMLESEALMALKNRPCEPPVKKQFVEPLPVKASTNLWVPLVPRVRETDEEKKHEH